MSLTVLLFMRVYPLIATNSTLEPNNKSTRIVLSSPLLKTKIVAILVIDDGNDVRANDDDDSSVVEDVFSESDVVDNMSNGVKGVIELDAML